MAGGGGEIGRLAFQRTGGGVGARFRRDERVAQRVSHGQPFLLRRHDALMTELNRADQETWLMEIPEDRQQAIKEAEERIVAWMKENQPLGVGQSW